MEELEMAGYYGYKMSNNAVEAYEDGEMPLSKWTKTAILNEVKRAVEDGDIEISFDFSKFSKLTVKILKSEFLRQSSWHHTSSWYNCTNFYSVYYSRLEQLTDEEIAMLAEKKEEPKQEVEKAETYKCSYLEWSGSRRHPKATRYTDIGIIKGDWFYINGTNKKKKVSANGFEILEKVG